MRAKIAGFGRQSGAFGRIGRADGAERGAGNGLREAGDASLRREGGKKKKFFVKQRDLV